MPILRTNLNEYRFYVHQLSGGNTFPLEFPIEFGEGVGLSSSTSIYDLEHKFLLEALSVTSGNTVDLWKEWLKSKGITFTNMNDSWNAYLLGLGYSGNLQDMQDRYFEDNS